MKGDPQALINQQVRRWILEQEAAREAEHGRDRKPTAPRPIVTVSRQIGSGGSELAELVAGRLGYQLFDKEVIEVVAREFGVQRDIVEALDERARSAIEQWVDGVLHSRIVTSEDFVRSLAKALIMVARTGSAVIVGRGANYILEGEPLLSVRVVARREYRIRRVMRMQCVEEPEAERIVAQADRQRAQFIQRYIHRNLDDPTSFDLILNLERIGLDRGADAVVNLYREMFPLLRRETR